MEPVMHIVPRKMRDQSIDKQVPMDTKNMHGTPERVSAQAKLAHRKKQMGCNK